MTLDEAIAELRRVTRIDGDSGQRDTWRGADFAQEQSAYEPTEIDHAIAVILNAVIAGKLVPATEVQALVDALRPFSRMSGEMFARNWNKDGVAISFVTPDGPLRLTFADFLAVRAALTAWENRNG